MKPSETYAKNSPGIPTRFLAALTIAGVLALLPGVGAAQAQEVASESFVDFAFGSGAIEVAADDGSFDSGTFDSGGTFSRTFDTPLTGAAFTFEEEPKLGLPDLVITGITYERQYWQGLVYDLHVTVKNQGSAGSGLGGFCVEVRLPSGSRVVNCTSSGLPAGSSVVIQNLDVFPYEVCGQRVLVVADAQTDVVESNESNNSRWWSAPSCT